MGEEMSRMKLGPATTYALAVANGYVGTLEQWLAEQKGPKGDTPYIGENGTWWVGGTDTGVKAHGEDGGYYTPEITQLDENTMRVSFVPSAEGMPAVEPVDIALPAGPPGASPTVAVARNATDTGVVISAENADGTKSETELLDGKDGGIAITGATVGQIAKITEVDENGKPTAWEAADMGSGGGTGYLPIVALVELTEEATSITISQDVDGNDFELTEMVVYAFFSGGANNGDGVVNRSDAKIYLNGYNTAVQGTGLGTVVPAAGLFLPYAFSCKKLEYGYHVVFRDGFPVTNAAREGIIFFDAAEKNMDTNAASSNDKSFKSLTIYCANTEKSFGVGTKITIYGR